MLFEQPCPTLEECLIVRERTTLPMVLDEVITDVQSLMRAYGGDGGGQPQARPRRRADAARADARPRRSSSGCASRSRTAGAATSRPPRSRTSRRRRRPDALLMASFMNDWTLDHIAGYEPRSRGGRGAAPDGPGPRRRGRRRGPRRAAAQYSAAGIDEHVIDPVAGRPSCRARRGSGSRPCANPTACRAAAARA